MTPKQQRFVTEYLIDGNATQAAIRAGYGPKNANVVGPRLLVNVGIQQAIAAGQQTQALSVLQRLEEVEVTAARTIQEVGRLAFSDTRSFYDAHGNLKPVQEWTAAQGAQVAAFEVIKKNAAAGDGVVDTIHKFKVWDKVRSLELLMKHFALLTERVDVSGGLVIHHVLHDGRDDRPDSL